MTDVGVFPQQDRTSNIRNIVVTPQSARISAGVPFSPTGSNKRLVSGAPPPLTMIAARFSTGDPNYRFVFPYSPQAVTYGDLSPEIVTLDRPGKKPIVAFSKLKARRVTLEFLLAVPFDGMHIDIEDAIQLLEVIAASGRTVWFKNADSFLSFNNFRDSNYNPSFFWSIVEFSFQSLRRNRAQKITQAAVSLSLIENSNPRISVANLPRIAYGATVTLNNPPASQVPPVPVRDSFMTVVDRGQRSVDVARTTPGG